MASEEELDAASRKRLSGLAATESSSVPPPPSSSLPGSSGVNDRRTALVGAAARDEASREDEMTSYLNSSAKLFSCELLEDDCRSSFASCKHASD